MLSSTSSMYATRRDGLLKRKDQGIRFSNKREGRNVRLISFVIALSLWWRVFCFAEADWAIPPSFDYNVMVLMDYF